MKMQLEEIRAKLEKVRWKEGGLWQKSYFWEGRCDGLEKVNSPFWVVELQRFLHFSPQSVGEMVHFDEHSIYFSDGWFNYANYSFLKYGRFWVIYSESVFFLTMCCFCVFSRDSNACLLRC